jgi:hypothetical protein
MVSLPKPALPLKLAVQIRHNLYFSMILSALITEHVAGVTGDNIKKKLRHLGLGSFTGFSPIRDYLFIYLFSYRS